MTRNRSGCSDPLKMSTRHYIVSVVKINKKGGGINCVYSIMRILSAKPFGHQSKFFDLSQKCQALVLYGPLELLIGQAASGYHTDSAECSAFQKFAHLFDKLFKIFKKIFEIFKFCQSNPSSEVIFFQSLATYLQHGSVGRLRKVQFFFSKNLFFSLWGRKLEKNEQRKEG